MIASLYLLGCVLIPGQAPTRPVPLVSPLSQPAVRPVTAPVGRGNSWQVAPQLDRSRELVYRGQFHEEANSTRVQFSRSYRLELRVFVLDVTLMGGAEAAFLTVLKSRDPQAAANQPAISDAPAGAARLEVLKVDAQGQLSSDPGTALNAPLEGAPSLEVGMFVPAPRERVPLDQDWQVGEANRPLRAWRIVGTEMVGGNNCLKLVGMQQSDDWDRPRADRGAWRRQDTVWLPPRLGYAVRVERKIELREAARDETTQFSLLHYDLESSLKYPGQMYDSRQQEIAQAQAFAAAAAPLLPVPQKWGPQLAVLQDKIDHHIDNQPPTPYREAVLQVKRRVEAARRGETPVTLANDPGPELPTVATVGKQAPDWVVTRYSAPGSARLRDWQGLPVVMIFYNPNSPVGEELLTYAQRLSDAYKGRLAVLLMTVVDQAEEVLKQREALKLSLPILSGSGLRICYEVIETPKLVVIDGQGIVRASLLGWGSETPAEISEELKCWLPPPPASSGDRPKVVLPPQTPPARPPSPMGRPSPGAGRQAEAGPPG